MINESPSRQYLKYLLLHPDHLSEEEIVARAERLKLDILGVWYLRTLRKEMHPPEGFNPLRKSHRPSQAFLFQERLHGLFYPDLPQRDADRILRAPRAREFVEAMLISEAPYEMIARAVATRFRLRVTTEGVARFKLIYWDVDALTQSDMRALLDFRVKTAEVHSDPDIARQSTSLARAGWKDPRRIAASLPSSPISALLAQMRLGVMPTNLNMQEILQRVQELSSLKSFEALQNDTLDSAQMSNLYMSTARSANEMLSSMATPEESLLRHLQKLTIKTDPEAVPTINALSQGSHTAEVQMLSNKEKVIK